MIFVLQLSYKVNMYVFNVTNVVLVSYIFNVCGPLSFSFF